MLYPADRPISWENITLCYFFDTLKYVMVVSIAFLLSTVSTSFFLPVFGTIAIYLSGNASQQVFDYLNSGGGNQLPSILRIAAKALYYILPNLSAFDYKAQAIYGISINPMGIVLTFCYFVLYTITVLAAANTLYSRREIS
jgi:uncharacterized membrane protein